MILPGQSLVIRTARLQSTEQGECAMTTPRSQINLQDGYLNQVRKESTIVTVFLVNGCKLRGVVRGFDNFTIILESDGRQHLVYKHAVSTVSAADPVRVGYNDRRSAAETPEQSVR